MKINSVNIIGGGKVALTFLKLLDNSGVQIKSVMTSRNLNGFDQKFKVVRTINELNLEVDLNIVCVKDDVISELINRMPKQIATVHTSGSVPLSVFEGFAGCGIFYPLQTFSENRTIDLTSSYFLLESTGSLQLTLKEFCESYFSKKILFCNSEQRSQIHLSAVFANNFVNHLLLCSKEILESENIDFKILEPLVIETISKAFDIGPLQAQTGPAIRNDDFTIKKHLQMIKDENLKSVYEVLTNSLKRKSI